MSITSDDDMDIVCGILQDLTSHVVRSKSMAGRQAKVG